MTLGFLKPVGGNIRLRYARPGYDADDLTLAQNLVAFDSANAGMFSIIAKGLWQGDLTTLTSKIKIVSWPTLPYIPLCTFAISPRNGAYDNKIDYGFYVSTIIGGQSAVGTKGLDVYYDGIYWQCGCNFGSWGSFAKPDHVSLWWIAHRMKAI